MSARIANKVAAGVMLVAPDGRVLLLRRGPHDESYPGHWNLPGGKCDAGEAPHDTAARECREETQLSPDALTLVRQETTPRGWTYHTYMSRVADAAEPVLADGEHDAHVWADLDKLPRPMHPGLQRVLLDWRRRAQRSGANDAWEENEHTRDADGKFATSGSEHLSARDRPEWFEEDGSRKLPRAREDWIESPIRPTKVPLYEMRRPGESVDANASKAELAELNLEDLETLQGHVDPGKMRVWDPDKAPPLEVYKLGGKYIIGNGNHRAASAWAANAQKVKALVLDLDKHQKLLKPKYRKKITNDRNVTMDAASVRTIDSAGHMRVASSPLTKANICEYYGREIPGCEELGLNPERRYRMYRDPKELKAAAGAFAGKPLLLVHAPAFAQDYPREVTIGSVGDDVAFDGEYVRGPLTVWDGEGIRAIQSGRQRELSASYDYTPDMTPGSVDGQAYDGVMRDIRPNHVAIVRKGRAGSDVLVADAEPARAAKISLAPEKVASVKETTLMLKTTLPSRRALLTQGALTAYLLPRLAEDAEIDLAPALRGVNNKNFVARVPKIVAAVEKMCEGKLAADADISDVAEMLDALKGVKADEPMALPDPAGAEAALAGQDDDPVPGAEGAEPAPGTEGADPEVPPLTPDPEKDAAAAIIGKVLEFLRDKLSPDDMAAVTALCTEDNGAGAEDNDEPGDTPPVPGKEDDMKNMVTKPAMDEAIAAATAAARQQGAADAIRIANEIRTAEREAEVWVGKTTIAYDCAEAVYRGALKMLNVPNVDTLHADALRPVLLAQPKPSRDAPVIALDAAAVKSFGERFAGAGNIQRM